MLLQQSQHHYIPIENGKSMKANPEKVGCDVNMDYAWGYLEEIGRLKRNDI